MGRDHLSSKLYNGLLTKNKIRPNDPLLILNYYHGKLLRVCKDTLARYVLCLRRFLSELPHINQASIILMGPRAKKIEYHNILVNLITYYINMELKKMIANDPGQISSNVVIKYIDFFFPYLSAGVWNHMTLELYAENEKNYEKKYGAVHYTPTVYKDLLNLIKR